MSARERFLLAVALMCALAGPGLSGSAVAAAPLDDRLGVRTPLVFLLIRPDIQKDLGLDAGQIADGNRFAEEIYRRALALKSKSGPGVLAARRAIDEAESEWLKAHLKAEQRERLGQIDLQWEGVTALLRRPVVIDFLGLTDEQRDQVSRIYSERMKARVRPGPWTYEEHLEMTRTAIAILTDKQKHLWAKVLGRPCRFVIGPESHAPARPSASTGNDSASRS